MPTQDRSSGADRERQLLLAARETGALDALVTTTGTPEGLAAETGLEERAARLLIEALAECGFLTRPGGEYQPTNRLLGFLARRDVRSIGRLPHELDRLAAWHSFAGGGADRRNRTDERLRNELGARAAADDARVRGAVTAALRAHPGADHVVCVGDGPGRHAVEFAARDCEVTLVDRPAVVDVVAPALEHEPVTVVAGDPRGDLPAADLVFGAERLVTRDDEDASRVLAAAAGAVKPGAGVAVFVEPVADETPGAALRSLEAHVVDGGAVHAGEDLRSWADEAGFAGTEFLDIPGDDRLAVVARWPRS